MKSMIAWLLAASLWTAPAMAADEGNSKSQSTQSRRENTEGWLKHVPLDARGRRNPLTEYADAAAAGGKLFRHNCASCHGEDARGRGSRPSLRSARVQGATDGELEWLLTNGDLGHGMPSWSRLPEGERWQIVRYLRTLPLE